MIDSYFCLLIDNIQYVEALLAETTTLLKEVMILRNNKSTTSHQQMNENNKCNDDKIQLQLQLLELQGSLSKTESLLLLCDEKVDAMNSSSSIVKVNTQLNNANANNNDNSSHESKKKWLVVGIPTVSRQHSEDYLLRTLASINHQLPLDPLDIMYNQILFIVVNVQGVGHDRFEEAKLLYSDKKNPTKIYYEFITLKDSEMLKDVKDGATPLNDAGNANVPGYFFPRSPTHSLTHSLTHSITHSFTYLLTHSSTQVTGCVSRPAV